VKPVRTAYSDAYYCETESITVGERDAVQAMAVE
jgi:hypothetical protein